MVRRALAAGADVNEPSKSGPSPLESDPPICVAAAGIQSATPDKDGAAIIKELLRVGAEVNVRTPTGWTALMRVANSNNLEALDLLIEAGADVNAQADDGRTPLMGAVHIGNADIVERLLEAGADPGLEDTRGRTALSNARHVKNKRVISLLKKASGDVTETKGLD